MLLLEKFKDYEHFCKCLLDGFALLDPTGKVIKCNALLSQLLGVPTKHILKANSLDELVKFKINEEDMSIKDLLTRHDPGRVDEVKSITGNKEAGNEKELNCIIGVYPFTENGNVLGTFILLRDVTAETQLQTKYKDKATQSITDVLTGLFNRAYFEEYLGIQEKQLLQLPQNSEHRKLTMVMFDIDHFKKINDNFGHQAGDHVIKHVAKMMLATFRKTDVVCRYGGEEFLAILPSSDSAGAFVAADKVRKLVEGFKFEYDGKTIPVTISSGLAQVLVGQETAKQTIGRADAALYASKQNGRNRVSMHDGTRIILANDFTIKSA